VKQRQVNDLENVLRIRRRFRPKYMNQ
jgi:hypothetical protein